MRPLRKQLWESAMQLDPESRRLLATELLQNLGEVVSVTLVPSSARGTAGFVEMSHALGGSADEGATSVRERLASLGRISTDEALMELAVLLYSQDRLTLGQGARLAGMPQAQFLQLLGSRGINIHYDVEEFEHDLETIRRLSLA